MPYELERCIPLSRCSRFAQHALFLLEFIFLNRRDHPFNALEVEAVDKLKNEPCVSDVVAQHIGMFYKISSGFNPVHGPQ